MRPSARQWAESLGELESQCRKCATDPGHYYFAGLPTCPWCRIESGNGPTYFISVSIQLLSVNPTKVDVSAVWTRINGLPRPNAWWGALQNTAPIRCTPRPFPPEFHSQKQFMRVMGILAALSTSLLLFGLYDPAFLIVMLPVCACIVAVWFVFNMNSPHYVETKERKRRVTGAAQAIATAERSAGTALAQLQQEFDRRLNELATIKGQFDSLQTQESREIQQLQLHAQERQRDDFLEKFFVKDAKIEGIGPGRIATLESFGVETAADITYTAIGNVPGFGEKLTARLMTWRQTQEARFRFDPNRGVPPQDLLRLRNKYVQMLYSCQRRLEGGVSELTKIATAAKAEAERSFAGLGSLRLALSQAQADLAVCR